LLAGLVGFAAASSVGAAVGSPAALIAVRFVMGAFAAMIYPTTLSVINNVFPDRAERAKAIGLWGAVTGLGVAFGPVTGGFLLAHYSWPSVFIALVPVALLGAILTFAFVPESSNPAEAHVDVPGLVASSAAIGSLVYTIIEAPGRGWGSVPTLVGFAITAALIMSFIVLEYRSADPMIDVSLFRTPAFSAASGAVTVCFFALYGFIFLITQYFQFVRGYGTLSTGARILPVAVTIGVGSVAGARLAGRIGTRIVVVTGLILFAGSFAWMAVAPTFLAYGWIMVVMVLMGLGLGLTSAPATESILSVLPPAKTGVGSAVNDATREAGGTLGVAVIGSVFLSLYARRIDSSLFAHLPTAAHTAARTSVAAATQTIARAPAPLQRPLLTGFNSSFMSGLHTASAVAAGVCILGALGALALPGRRGMAISTAAARVAGSTGADLDIVPGPKPAA
jgi:EmrB/QacA subfamily drug resistance transporter